MLLTDGWYETDNRTENFQAYYWDVEAEEETRIDVTDGGSDFIDDGATGDEETWGNLYGADWTYLVNKKADWQKVYATNIAGYSETADGYALKSVEDSAERMDYTVQAFEVDGLKDESLDAIGSQLDIQTTTDTQYYLVIRSRDNKTVTGWTVDDVITWTGYKNAPAEAKLVDGAVGYAVTHASKASDKYTVADVVVFETAAYADRDTYFVYAPNNYLDFIDRDRVEHVWGIGYDDEGVIDTENQLLVEKYDDVIVDNGLIEFYEIFDNQTVNFIGDEIGEYAEHNIYAGWARTSWDVEGRNYVRVEVAGADDMYIYDDAPVYKVTFDARDGYGVAELNRDKVDVQNYMILFTDGEDNVKYAINVSASLYEKAIINEVFALWTDISGDAYSMETLTFYGVADADGDNEITVPYAVAAENKGGLDVGSGRSILSITSGGRSVTIPDAPDTKSGVVYTVVTETKTSAREVWTLTVLAAGADARLYNADTTTEASSFDLSTVTDLTIQEFVDKYELADDNASIVWTFTTVGGTKFSFTGMTAQNVPYNVTMSEIESVVAKVIAENGVDSKTYKDTDSVQDDADAALAEAIAEAKVDMNKAVIAAVKAADTTGLVSDYDAVPGDDTTSFTYGGTPYTMKGLLDVWAGMIDGQTSESDLETFMTDSVLPQATAAATAYLGALQSGATSAADTALNALYYDLAGKECKTATVSDPADFEAAIDAAVKALVTDTKATVTVSSYGDLATQIASLTTNAGNLTVTGVKVELTYEGTTNVLEQTLGDITVPYNVNK